MENLYTDRYVNTQLEKFRSRHTNHWKNHIRLAKKLVAEYAPKPPASLLDLGCSIGTFALEFALDGYVTTGLDFDPKALDLGVKLARELGCSPQWICADASAFHLRKNVDIIVCFDLLEHLNDNTIVRTLSCVRDNLSQGGVFAFHTFPTQFDHIFYRGAMTSVPLIPFRSLPDRSFEIAVRMYSYLVDLYYLLRRGKTHRGYIARTVHPNPLSKERLKKFLEDAGFTILCLEMDLDSINPLKPAQGTIAKKYFAHQPVALRSLWGAASIK